MQVCKFFSFGIMVSAVIATNVSPLLLSRQVTKVPCSEIFKKDCGEGCIDLTDTCCPQKQGGCPLLTYCVVGDNGLDGCCDIGKTCVGDGGTNTDIDTYTSIRTSTYTIASTTRHGFTTTSSTSSSSSSYSFSPLSTPSSTTRSISISSSSSSSMSTPTTRSTSSTSSSGTSTQAPQFTSGSSGSSVDARMLPIAAIIFAAVVAY